MSQADRPRRHDIAAMAPQPPADEAAWWAAARGGDAIARDRLIAAYLPFARMLAAKMFAARIDHDQPFDEYLQFGTVGLIEAVDRFDPQLGILFKTYAAYRINGAMRNGLEHLSEKREQIATRQRLQSERRDSAKAVLEEAPQDVFQQLAEMAIGLALGYMLDDPSAYQRLETSQPENQYSAAEMRQLRERIHSLLDRLPEQEKMVIKYHYLQQVAFGSIAATMEVSNGRISQLHRQGLTRLRSMMKAVKTYDSAW